MSELIYHGPTEWTDSYRLSNCYRLVHLPSRFFLAARGTSKTDHIIGHKAILGKCRKTDKDREKDRRSKGDTENSL